MGFAFVGFNPMFTSIELSSDDEVQIVGEDVRKPKSSIQATPVKNQHNKAVERLSRNCNIELTINLENNSLDEDKFISSSTRNNGIPKNENHLPQKTQEEKKEQAVRRDTRSESPDIVIIDDDVPQKKKTPQKNTSTTSLHFQKNIPPKSQPEKVISNTGNNHRRSLPLEPHRQQSTNKPRQSLPVKNHLSNNNNNNNNAKRVLQPLKTNPFTNFLQSQRSPPTSTSTPNKKTSNVAEENKKQASNVAEKSKNRTSNSAEESRKSSTDEDVVIIDISDDAPQQDKPRPTLPKIQLPPPVIPNIKSPLQNSILNDVVYIIDDKSDEESDKASSQSQPKNGIKNSSTLPSSAKRYSQHLVNVLRSKLEIGNSKKEVASSNDKPQAKAAPKKNKELAELLKSREDLPLEPLDSKRTTRNSLGKKRIAPERITDLSDDSPFRVTRSAFSLPSTTPDKKTSKSQQSTSKASSSSSGLKIVNQPMNKYSIENMFRGLVKVCNKIFTDKELEEKLWRTFKHASEKILRSEEFINALKVALKTSEEITIDSLDDKLLVSREVKEVMRIMKRHPEVVDKKVKKLTKMLNLIRSRIRKIEETEVTSDEEEENVYVLLDRYRARATKIYEKLCELQNMPSDAGRIVRQKFHFSGNSGYPKIEQALEKYYYKTKSFPDFVDVKTLVEKTVAKENLNIPPYNIHNIAQTVFIEFGNKLKRMRCCDEYSIINDYLDEGTIRDPALTDDKLKQVLSSNNTTKRLKEAEQKILDDFVCRQAEMKAKGETKDESSESDTGAMELSDGEGPSSRGNEKSDLHFSDTDEELLNREVEKENRQMDSSEEDEEDEDFEPPLKSQKLDSTSNEVSDKDSGEISCVISQVGTISDSQLNGDNDIDSSIISS